MTLKELWQERGFTPTQLAAQCNMSTSTLYKMNRGEHVSSASIARVCKVLGITRREYEKLDTE